MGNKKDFTDERDYRSKGVITIKRMDDILNVLRSAFDSLDYISDTCDDEQTSPSECLEQIRLTANGELAELEELIIKLQSK